jgi:hypothetical protein
MGRFIRLFLYAPSAGLVDADAVPAVIALAVVQPHSVFISHDQGFPVLRVNKLEKNFVPEMRPIPKEKRLELRVN